MRSCALFTLFVALLAGSRGGNPGHNRIVVNKCCGEYEMLSGDGRSCVKTDWPPNIHVRLNIRFLRMYAIFSPLDEDWVRRWLPPGLPLHRVQGVISKPINGVILPVNASCDWNNQTCVGKNVMRTQVIFSGELFVLRPTPGGGLKEVQYCVDAALPPLGPFAMRLRTDCPENECVKMCCDFGQVMVNQNGKWSCNKNKQSDLTTFNASFAGDDDPEFPFRILRNCPRIGLADPQDFTGISKLYTPHVYIFNIWLVCTAHYHNHGTLQEGLFFCEYPNVAKGIYWMLRPLCVVSALLLAMALLGIACDGSMRRKVHGWCLASHALCLFGFNVGQIVYYVQVKDTFDIETKTGHTQEYTNACKHFDENDELDEITMEFFSYKYGTALFYYGPVLSLVLCNVASLFITLRKIKRLRRGNSVLRREEDLTHGQPQGNPLSAANIESANGGTSGSGNGGSSRREVDSKRIKMYLKMILMTGALEIISEVIIWATTNISIKSFENEVNHDVDYTYTSLDYHLPYRSSGHVTDFLRAACVAWLAAPEGGYLGPILRRLRGEKK